MSKNPSASQDPQNAPIFAASFLFDAEAPPPAQSSSGLFRAKHVDKSLLSAPHIDQHFGELPKYSERSSNGFDKRVVLKWICSGVLLLAGLGVVGMFVHKFSGGPGDANDGASKGSSNVVADHIPTVAPVMIEVVDLPSMAPTVFAPIPGNDAPSPMADPTSKLIDEIENMDPKEQTDDMGFDSVSMSPTMAPTMTDQNDGTSQEAPRIPDNTEYPSMSPTDENGETNTSEEAPRIPDNSEYPSTAPSNGLPVFDDEWSEFATMTLLDDLDQSSGDTISAMRSMAFTPDGKVLVVGIPERDNNSGHVLVYELSIFDNPDSNGVQQNEYESVVGTTNALHGRMDAQLGLSVAVSSDGHFVATGGAGLAKSFDFNHDQWEERGNMLEDVDGQLGTSLATSSDGNTLAVVSPNYGDGGRVQVFSYMNNEWVLKGNEGDLDGQNAQSVFGVDLSGDGTRVAMALYSEFGNDVSIKIYEYKDDQWAAMDTAEMSAPAVPPTTGNKIMAMSQDGTTVAFGVNKASVDTVNPADSLVMVFRATGTEGKWFELGTAVPSPDGHQVVSIDLSSNGNRMAVGTDDNGDDDDGHAKAYQFSNNFWMEVGRERDGAVVAIADNGEDDNIVLFAIGNERTGVVKVHQLTPDGNPTG